MTRTKSRELWQRIADGDLAKDQYDPVDLHAWIREVANKLLTADINKRSTDRPYDITRAVGLSGTLDEHKKLRELVAIASAFSFYDAQGNPREPKRGESVKTLVAMARRHKLVDEQSSDIEVAKLIDRLYPEISRAGGMK